jgi:uncharacterized protein YcbX
MGDLMLSEIWIYPIKSLGGIRLPSSPVMQKGLRYDRRWMLIDEHDTFMTQREHPGMALFKVGVCGSELTVTFDQHSTCVPIDPTATGARVKTRVWDDDVEVIEGSRGSSIWFSEMMGVKCKLVSFPEENARGVDPKYKINEEQVSLADAYPFLIIGEQTLADLNRRLKQPLPMNRFRPNLVFSGGKAFEEDAWRNFRIGRNRFVGVKPCGRCAVTTVDQATGEKGVEPLATLSTYRKRDGKVYFGQNVIAIDHGEIVEGDEIVLG